MLQIGNWIVGDPKSFYVQFVVSVVHWDENNPTNNSAQITHSTQTEVEFWYRHFLLQLNLLWFPSGCDLGGVTCTWPNGWERGIVYDIFCFAGCWSPEIDFQAWHWFYSCCMSTAYSSSVKSPKTFEFVLIPHCLSNFREDLQKTKTDSDSVHGIRRNSNLHCFRRFSTIFLGLSKCSAKAEFRIRVHSSIPPTAYP